MTIDIHRALRAEIRRMMARAVGDDDDTARAWVRDAAYQHCRNYGAMLARAKAGNPNYRADELETLIGVWTATLAVQGDVEAMALTSLHELYDFLFSEGLADDD